MIGDLHIMRCVIGRQAVRDAHLRRLPGNDTTGRDGDVGTRPRDRRSRDLPRPLLPVRPLRCGLRGRASAVSRRALWDTRWPRLLSGALLPAADGATAGRCVCVCILLTLL